MALFGKKAKDDPAAAPDDSNGTVLVADNDEASDSDAVASGAVAAPAKRAKAPRAPKPAKSTKLKSGTAVGLNIGNQWIKAVEVTSKGGELTVTAMGAVPTPPESYTNGNVLSVSALSNAIKDLWRNAGIKSKVAITSVAGTGALVVRVIEVPKMTDGELRDNMKVDADRYIPFPPSEVIMDFKALRDLPSDPDAPNMEVLLAAAQREIIDLHVKVVQTAKLEPRAIDVETIAATRALQLERRGSGYVDYNEVTGVVNLGATGAEISILRGDVVVFTRVVPNGGNAITQAISEGLGMPFSDAERVKVNSADALAPAGYGTGGEDFGFGNNADDFNFSGDEFSGGDFNSAFEDIAANPSGTAAASDDPFDLDFFNQGPAQDEPGAGHAQKEGEEEEAPAFSFDFAAPPTPTASDAAMADSLAAAKPDPAPTEPSSGSGGISFNFGDADEEVLPSIDDSVAPTSTGAKGTGQLDDFGFDAADTTPLPVIEDSAPAATTATPSPSAGYSALIPSAFDFDNFDLPGVHEEGLSTVAVPIESAPPLPPVAPAPNPASFAPQTPPPPAPADSRPASFGLEDEDLASVAPAPAVPAPASDPFSLSLPAEPAVTTPAPTFAAEPVAEPDEIDDTFGFTEPAAPTAETAPMADPLVVDTSFDTSFADAPLTDTTAPVTTPVADSAEDFDLDSIFGDTQAMPSVAAPAAADDEFDLSGIETDLGSFAGGFNTPSDDFTAFGTGLESNASTDAATLYSLIYPPLEELSNEVRRSLEFHLGRYPDATISRLVLLGGGAKLRNIDVFFTQSLGVPTVVANPFSNITVNLPKLAPEYATENGPLCTVALGLALRDFVD